MQTMLVQQCKKNDVIKARQFWTCLELSTSPNFNKAGLWGTTLHPTSNHRNYTTLNSRLGLLKTSSSLVHGLFLICSWLVYDFFMVCSWLAHDLMSCSWLFCALRIAYSWLAHDLVATTCSTCLSLFHELFMTCSWLFHYLLMNCSRLS